MSKDVRLWLVLWLLTAISILVLAQPPSWPLAVFCLILSGPLGGMAYLVVEVSLEPYEGSGIDWDGKIQEEMERLSG